METVGVAMAIGIERSNVEIFDVSFILQRWG